MHPCKRGAKRRRGPRLIGPRVRAVVLSFVLPFDSSFALPFAPLLDLPFLSASLFVSLFFDLLYAPCRSSFFTFAFTFTFAFYFPLYSLFISRLFFCVFAPFRTFLCSSLLSVKSYFLIVFTAFCFLFSFFASRKRLFFTICGRKMQKKALYIVLFMV